MQIALNLVMTPDACEMKWSLIVLQITRLRITVCCHSCDLIQHIATCICFLQQEPDNLRHYLSAFGIQELIENQGLLTSL